MKAAKSLDGIISYLTKKHGGNVHQTETVTITSKSVYGDGPEAASENVADLASDWDFSSNFGPDEWICWDFGKSRVLLTHYTIRCWLLKSWIVEGSGDGDRWTEIDRRTDTLDFKGNTRQTASFAVSKPIECRFIRLTTTDKRHDGNLRLVLAAVEFFGTLTE
jgi:hypothetical protein